MRRYLAGLVIAAIGGGLGWVAYWTQPSRWIVGACSGGVSTVPGVSVRPCVPPPAQMVPLDPVSAMWWSFGGVMLAIGPAAALWFLVIELRDRRRAH